MATNHQQSNIDNVLDLNDDCLIKIFKYLSLTELCAVAETCSRFQCVADVVFKCEYKFFGIPQEGVKFGDHQRILKNFGNLITTSSCVAKMCDYGINKNQIKLAFKWLERYCSEELQKVVVISSEVIALPQSAMRLMSKVKEIDLMLPISHENLLAVLSNCKELVKLKLVMYDGPFHLPNHRFPNLEELTNRVRVDPDTDFGQIYTFFKHHTKLTYLSTQFLNDKSSGSVIDFSFLKHLTNLTKLNLCLAGSKIVGTDAFAYLNNLQEFYIDGSYDKRTDTKILENLASIDSLVKLQLGMNEVSHLIAGIERFKNLSKLVISEDDMGPYDHFHYANISSLARLCNSKCTELEVSCMELLEPETIVNVARNLKEVKTIKLYCRVALTETISKHLASVCTSQKRKIVIILEKDIIANMDWDFNFIEKFNKEYGAFVEIKTEDSYFEVE